MAECTISDVNSKRYIRASEVGSFLYCNRAWRLGRRGATSALEVERAQGTAFHRSHGMGVNATKSREQTARWLIVAAAMLFVLALLWSLR